MSTDNTTAHANAPRNVPAHELDEAIKSIAMTLDTPTGHLARLTATRALRLAVEAHLSRIEHEEARLAWHEDGHSWRRIGEACGISRQTAQQTYQHGTPSRQPSLRDRTAAPPKPAYPPAYEPLTDEEIDEIES